MYPDSDSVSSWRIRTVSRAELLMRSNVHPETSIEIREIRDGNPE